MYLGKVKLKSGEVIYILKTKGIYKKVSYCDSLQDFIDKYGLQTSQEQDFDLKFTETVKEYSIAEFLTPIDSQEVWASGLTYNISSDKLEDLKKNKPEYYNVYMHKRPMLFFKSIGHKVVGQNANLGLMGESERVIPEAEVALLVNKNKKIIAYTSGNDVSVTSIENISPLFQSQAKYFEGGCALGPMWCLNTFDSFPEIKMSCSVFRDNAKVAGYEYTTHDLSVKPETIIDYLFSNRKFEDGVVLFLGSNGGVSPSYTAISGDKVIISNSLIEDLIGTFS